jgi:nucleoside 2-deoxyribosyltransferase
MKVYLSGRIAGLTYGEANEWRDKVTDEFESCGIKTLNPLRRRLFFHADDEKDVTPNEIVTRDLQDVRDCDLVFVYLPKSDHFSVGTICELWEAYRLQKPIVLVSDDLRYHKHPWILVACTRIFGSIPDAIEYIVTRWNDTNENMLPEKWS